jgi:hypothetical protein
LELLRLPPSRRFELQLPLRVSSKTPNLLSSRRRLELLLPRRVSSKTPNLLSLSRLPWHPCPMRTTVASTVAARPPGMRHTTCKASIVRWWARQSREVPWPPASAGTCSKKSCT